MKYLTKKLSIVILAFLLLLPSSAWGLQTFRRAIEPESLAQNARILADSGTIIDSFWINITLRTVKDQGVLAAAKFLADANFAVKKDGSDAVSTLYDISGNNNDAVQATGANQPIWTAAQQNGKAGLVFDGGDDVLSAAHHSSLDVHSGDYSVLNALKFNTSDQVEYVFEKGSQVTSYYQNRRLLTNILRYLVSDTADTNYDYYDTVTTMSSGIWKSVVHTRNKAGRTILVYFNGVEDGQNTITMGGQPTSSGTVGLDIGAQEGNTGNITMLWFCILSTLLSTAQRQALEILINSYYLIY